MRLDNLFVSLVTLISEMEEDVKNLEEFCDKNSLELTDEVDSQNSYILSTVHVLKDNKNCFGIPMEELDKLFKDKIKDKDALDIFLEKKGE